LSLAKPKAWLVRERIPFWRLILHYLGISSLAIGFAYKIIILVMFFSFREDIFEMLLPFSTASLISISLGLALYLAGGEVRPLKLGEAMSISALIWLFIPMLGSFPFILSGHLDPLSAYFESMSGFTATGLTMFYKVEQLPETLLLWRSTTQWIGGVGIIVLFLTILGRESTAGKLYAAEGRTDRIGFSIISTARWVWIIYIFYTILCALLLFFVIHDGFLAVNFAMTTLATSGFAPTDASVESLHSLPAEVIIIAFMVIGATSFVLHSHFLTRGIYNPLRLYRVRKRAPIREKASKALILEFLFMISLALIGSIIVSWAQGWDLRGGFFQAFSAISTTGHQNEILNSYAPISKTVLALLMVVGACGGSTGGALKSFRVLFLFIAIGWVVRRKLLPGSAVVPLKVGDRTYKDEDVMDVALYVFLYFGALIIGALIFMGAGYGLENSLLEVASAQGNVGLSVGITGRGMEAYQKVVLIIEMLLGRLEIIPVFVLLRRLFPL
jgi:trk system potassium uptake protein TrkH